MAEVVPIKEYIDVKVGSLSQRIDSDKELFLSKEEARAVALKLQFKETERRLETLNHEAARLAMMVTKEQFEVIVNQLKRDNEDSRNKIVELEKDKSNRDGRMYMFQFIWGVVLLILSWFVNHKL
jgi:hypothetical protein